MSQLPLVSDEEATEEVKRVFRDFRQGMGFFDTPNFMQILGSSATVSGGTWSILRSILLTGVLPRPLKEMILVAVSVQRNCNYCAAAHIACCKMLGIGESTMTALMRNLDDIRPTRTRDILKFAVKCATDVLNLTDEDYAIVRRHGTSDEELLEIIAMSCLSVYSNLMADATKVKLDPMLV